MYKKLIESKLIRITHEVTIHEGSLAVSIINDLKNIPPGCKMAEMSEDEDDAIISLLFVEEKEEKR